MRSWERDSIREEETEARRGFMEKVLDFLGFSSYTDTEPGRNPVDEREPDESPKRSAKPRVVSFQSAQRQLKVVVFEPAAFEDVQGIVDQLKNNRPVIVNLDETDRALAKRIVDFMSGAIYALAGGMQQVSLTIFLFTPPNVEITLGARAEPARERASFFNMGD